MGCSHVASEIILYILTADQKEKKPAIAEELLERVYAEETFLISIITGD